MRDAGHTANFVASFPRKTCNMSYTWFSSGALPMNCASCSRCWNLRRCKVTALIIALQFFYCRGDRVSRSRKMYRLKAAPNRRLLPKCSVQIYQQRQHIRVLLIDCKCATTFIQHKCATYGSSITATRTKSSSTATWVPLVLRHNIGSFLRFWGQLCAVLWWQHEGPTVIGCSRLLQVVCEWFGAVMLRRVQTFRVTFCRLYRVSVPE